MKKYVSASATQPLLALCLNTSANTVTLFYLTASLVTKSLTATSVQFSTIGHTPYYTSLGLVIFGANVTLYQDGNVILQAALSSMATDGSGNVVVGGQDPLTSSYFLGNMQQLFVYPYSISPGQVALDAGATDVRQVRGWCGVGRESGSTH